MTNILGYIFTLLFLILGGLLWCLLLLIVCIGAIGIIRIMLTSVLDFDFVKWYKTLPQKQKNEGKKKRWFKLNKKEVKDENKDI